MGEKEYIVLPAYAAGVGIHLNTGKIMPGIEDKMTLSEAEEVAQARADGFSDNYMVVKVVKIISPK
jgi:hypothetical protein